MRPQYTCLQCGKQFPAHPSQKPKFCSRACYFLARITPVEERFWKHVDRSGDCWLWTGAKKHNGYGVFGSDRAHRVSWVLHNGPIPDGLFVLHNCDVRYLSGDITYRRCINPAHLWLGSQGENIRDCWAKGRHRLTAGRGERHRSAKLTEQQVIEYRQAYGAGVPIATIARGASVGPCNIWFIVHGRTWKHIPAAS
jgi:HNH endonuclease